MPLAPAANADQQADQLAAVRAVERALMIALVCARHLGRYDWTGTLRIGQVMNAATWDCLPWPGADVRARPAARAAVNRAEAAASATCRILK